ncbi:uncharacterized protein zgc:113426 [Centropristis striata]|uniref:uncharacterized protein zgc:113426 n=1 Tax=Centropristis striata TaxID=184440 RepID=UPI0027E05F06|nr:uncharacterized protein zgc:113426 [Centropristis striata]
MAIQVSNTYRMTDRDIRLMIQLRATNAAIFTGRKNSAMRGWRAIRKEMGLQGMLSARQLKKKWDNLKDKYKVLKNPPLGMEMTQPNSWRWFHLMDEALSGGLAGTATIVQPSPLDEDEEDFACQSPLGLPNTEAAYSGLTLECVGSLEDVLELSGIERGGKVEAVSRTESPAEVVLATVERDRVRTPQCEPTVMESQPVINKNQTSILYATLLPDVTANTNKMPSFSRHTVRGDTVRERAEVDEKLVELQREWQALEREQAEFDRELIGLERDRELLNRDMATLERDRTVIERDRAAVERDRAAVERDRVAVDRDRLLLDRDRAFLDRDRAFLERDRVFLERAREDFERERGLLRRERDVLEREGTTVEGHHAARTTEKEVVLHTRFYQSLMAADLDPDQLETRQRLVSLFQKLVEKL